MAFLFLAYILCCLFLSVFIPIAEVFVLVGLICGIRDGKFHAVASFFSCFWLLVCSDTDNSPLTNGIIALSFVISFISAAKVKEIRFCLQF
jgi:hypothetical protein